MVFDIAVVLQSISAFIMIIKAHYELPWNYFDIGMVALFQFMHQYPSKSLNNEDEEDVEDEADKEDVEDEADKEDVEDEADEAEETKEE